VSIRARVLNLMKRLQPLRQALTNRPSPVTAIAVTAPGLRERRVRQFPQRQGGEFLVDPGVVHAA
jgi:hypothetical protein